jgi:PKHD-type hydroxylase
MFYVFPKAVKLSVCDDIVRECLRNELEKATVIDFNKDVGTEYFSHKNSRDDASVRKTSLYFIRDKNSIAIEIVRHYMLKANEQFFNYDIKYMQAPQFGVYEDGGFYGWHQDTIGAGVGEARKLSLSLVLSDPDDFEGGEFQFYNGGRQLPSIGGVSGQQVMNDMKAKGSIFVFDSRDWHTVTPVTKGTRYSVVCWSMGPNFK